MGHCVIWDRCILGFVGLVYWHDKLPRGAGGDIAGRHEKIDSVNFKSKYGNLLMLSEVLILLCDSGTDFLVLW